MKNAKIILVLTVAQFWTRSSVQELQGLALLLPQTHFGCYKPNKHKKKDLCLKKENNSSPLKA
jgi:hypothetical protein